MKRTKKVVRLKRPVRKLLVKILLTFALVLSNILLYHFLGIYGSLAVKNNLGSTLIVVGWIWLLAGQFMALYIMWE